MTDPSFYRRIRPENLPMPDHHIMGLIEYTLREDARIDTLTRLVSTNPSLTVQLLGIVNSAFFGFSRQIHTISEALVVLGMEQIQSLVLCFAVKESLSRFSIPQLDMDAFWGDSVRRGVAARELAKMVNGPVEEAFSAGMLQDIGLLVLFYMDPEKADRWPLLRPNLPEDRRAMEEALFKVTHDHMGGLLARKWGLPKSYARAISAHHRFEKPSRENMLPALIHLADLCNAVYTCHDKAGALKLLEKRSKLFFKLSDEQIQTLLSSLPEQVRQATGPLKIKPTSHDDFNQIMNQANQKLVEDNLTYRELTWKLQNSLSQRDEYAGRLEAELGKAREIQKSLQPDLKKFSNINAFNIPAYHLSGDFYDCFFLPSGAIGFCIGDVSGKGTAAALLMAKAISLFSCLCKVGDDISRVVEMMNAELYETAVRGMFVTFAGGWFDPVTHEVHLINMGHLPPLIMGPEKIIQVKPCGPPLGVMPNVSSPRINTIPMGHSRLFLYTDGFTEGRLKNDPPDQGLLGFKGFLNWLVQSRQMSVHEQVQWIKDQCIQRLAAQADDLTLMILSGESVPL
ncbi:MAG: HDOD domain-containing protein [Desulfobacter sp.]|nr:HDOD domain-containing protein [Desulfobacter sp.]